MKEVQSGLCMDYKKSTNYYQMWRAKDLVRDWYLGRQRRSFHLIPSLLDRIKEVDLDAVVDWSTQGDTKVFNRAFVCPSAMRNAMKYCQLVVCLDACHTKNRRFPMQLFMATALDGDMNVTILCYALAPVENFENWEWFLSLLQESVHGVSDVEVLFSSDRCKGLLAAVREVFPDTIHGHCVNYSKANVKKKLGKHLHSFVWGLCTPTAA